MRVHFIAPIILLIVYSCSDAQISNDNSSLAPHEFSQKIQDTNSVIILDVRTPGEYSRGHLKNAKNIDWNGSDFENQISLFDTAQPIFVYCLSGGRSSLAANKMRSMGFSKVYELKGGISKWRSDGLPETTVLFEEKGMNRKQFDSILVSEKLVLVNFYAPWCAPCKKMKPDLVEIEKDQEGKVKILRIDADENQFLFKQLNLETIPTLLVYKGKEIVWSHSGYIGKKEIIDQLNSLK